MLVLATHNVVLDVTIEFTCGIIANDNLRNLVFSFNSTLPILLYKGTCSEDCVTLLVFLLLLLVLCVLILLTTSTSS